MMGDFDLVITNGVCVTASDVSPYDVAISGEKIVLLAPSGSLKDASTKRLIDAEGGYVMVSNGGINHNNFSRSPTDLWVAWRH